MVAASHVVAQPALVKLQAAAQSSWAGGITQDVIDDRFAESPLTLPLPPLIGREWGAEATHPDIPLAINTPPLEVEGQPLPAEAAAQDPANADAGAGFGTAMPTQGPGAGMGPGRPGGEFSGPGPGRGRMGPESGPGMGPTGRRFGGGPGGGPEGGGSYRGGGSGQPATEHTFLPKGVDYYLLRFFDFSVEPGKKYKYRVKLVLKDPNFNMPQSVLSPAVLDRQAKEAYSDQEKEERSILPVSRKMERSDPSRRHSDGGQCAIGRDENSAGR